MTSYGRYIEFIEVCLESIIVEVRVIESHVEINGKQISTSKWLMPYHWQQVYYILRAAATKHFDEEDVMIGPIGTSVKDVQVILKFIPFLAAYQYIIKPYNITGNSLDALKDTGEKWLEPTPYKYMIVAVVSPVCVNGFAKVAESKCIGTEHLLPKHLADENFHDITWMYFDEVSSPHYPDDSSSHDSFGSGESFHEEKYSKYTGVVTKVYKNPVDDDFTPAKCEPDVKFRDNMLDYKIKCEPVVKLRDSMLGHTILKRLRSGKVNTKTIGYDSDDSLVGPSHEKKKKGRRKCNSNAGEVYETSSDKTSSDKTSDSNVSLFKKSRRRKCGLGPIEPLSRESCRSTSDSNCEKKITRKGSAESSDKSKKKKTKETVSARECKKKSACTSTKVCEVGDTVKQESTNNASKKKVKSTSVNKLSSKKQRKKSVSDIKEEINVGELSDKTSTHLKDDTENSDDFKNIAKESPIKKRKSCTLNIDELVNLTSKKAKKVERLFSDQGHNKNSANKNVCNDKEGYKDNALEEYSSVSDSNIFISSGISSETYSDDYVSGTPNSTTQFSILSKSTAHKSTLHNVKSLDSDFKETEVSKRRKGTKPKSDTVHGVKMAESSGVLKQSKKKNSKLSTKQSSKVPNKRAVKCNNIRSYFSPLPKKDDVVQPQSDKNIEEHTSSRNSSDSIGIASDTSTGKTEVKLDTIATDHNSSFEEFPKGKRSNVSSDSSSPRKENSKSVLDDNVTSRNFEQNEINQNTSESQKFSVLHLTSEDLDVRFEENVQYLNEIIKGKRPCKRHDKYKAGGYRGAFRDYSLGTVPFTLDQLDHVMNLLRKHFCKKNSYVTMSDYFMTVLLPEACTKIFMDIFSLSHEAALSTIHKFYIRSTCSSSPLL